MITAGAFAQTHTATNTTNSTYPAGTHTLAGLDVAQTWTAAQTFTSSDFILKGSSSGTTTINATAAASGIITVPAVTDTLAVLGTAQTFTANQTVQANESAYLFIEPNHAITVTTNAGSSSISYGLQTFTNSSAATMTITLTVSGATDGQTLIIRIYDFSAVAETITLG